MVVREVYAPGQRLLPSDFYKRLILKKNRITHKQPPSSSTERKQVNLCWGTQDRPLLYTVKLFNLHLLHAALSKHPDEAVWPDRLLPLV